MRIIKHRKIVNDAWRECAFAGGDACDGGGDLPGLGDALDQHLIVSLDDWRRLRARDELLRGVHAIGVKLQPDESVDAIVDDLSRLALIALVFDAFNEGRGYSQAAQLREHHFRGEIRALGAHRDNLAMMANCGIDAYQLADGEDWREALSAFDEITAQYNHARPLDSTQ